MERKTSRSLSVRVGGGFMYQTEELQLGLEDLFEHKSAVPWTANTETRASGPKYAPSFSPGDDLGRVPKFPPSTRDILTEAVLPPPERKARPGSASAATGRRRSARGANPWAGASSTRAGA